MTTTRTTNTTAHHPLPCPVTDELREVADLARQLAEKANTLLWKLPCDRLATADTLTELAEATTAAANRLTP